METDTVVCRTKMYVDYCPRHTDYAYLKDINKAEY